MNVKKKKTKKTYQHGSLFPQRGTCLTLGPGRQTCRMGPKESLVCLHAQSRAGTSRHLQQTHNSFQPPINIVCYLKRVLFQSTFGWTGDVANLCVFLSPSHDCCPVRRLYPAVHMQALVVGEVGRHSWEQSPLL